MKYHKTITKRERIRRALDTAEQRGERETWRRLKRKRRTKRQEKRDA